MDAAEDEEEEAATPLPYAPPELRRQGRASPLARLVCLLVYNLGDKDRLNVVDYIGEIMLGGPDRRSSDDGRMPMYTIVAMLKLRQQVCRLARPYLPRPVIDLLTYLHTHLHIRARTHTHTHACTRAHTHAQPLAPTSPTLLPASSAVAASSATAPKSPTTCIPWQEIDSDYPHRRAVDYVRSILTATARGRLPTDHVWPLAMWHGTKMCVCLMHACMHAHVCVCVCVHVHVRMRMRMHAPIAGTPRSTGASP